MTTTVQRTDRGTDFQVTTIIGSMKIVKLHDLSYTVPDTLDHELKFK
jgi:hypothetical protein